MAKVISRLRSKAFWLSAVLLVAVVQGVHLWRPWPVAWDTGLFLHHLTLFGALYWLLRHWYEPHLAFSAALGLNVVPLVFTGAPLGQWTAPWLGEFSLMTSSTVILTVLMDYRWRRRLKRLFPLWFVGVMALAGLLASLGQWVSMDIFPYFHGDNAWWLTHAVIVTLVLLCLSGHYWAATLVAAVSVGYEWRLLDSHNAWDYLADVYWLPALGIVLWQRSSSEDNV